MAAHARVAGVGEYLRLGSCLDDAPGEILDKIARALNLQGGGASLEKLASHVRTPFDVLSCFPSHSLFQGEANVPLPVPLSKSKWCVHQSIMHACMQSQPPAFAST